MTDTERMVEVPWLLSRLGRPKRLLDIGSAGAEYLHGLRATKAEVTLVDTQVLTMDDVETYQGSVHALPAEWTGRFDLVTCVSVLDHVGLAAYGNVEEPAWLDLAAQELARVTARCGRLLLTVPFGRDHITTHPGGGQRVFDYPSLMELFPADTWVQQEISFWRLAGERYMPADWCDVREAEYGGWRARACVGMELIRQ